MKIPKGAQRPVRTCANPKCWKTLPSTSRSSRKTCSVRCQKAVYRLEHPTRTPDPLREEVLLRDDRCCVVCATGEGDTFEKTFDTITIMDTPVGFRRKRLKFTKDVQARLFVRQVFAGARIAANCVTLCSRHHGIASAAAFKERTGMSLGAHRRQRLREALGDARFSGELKAFSDINRSD